MSWQGSARRAPLPRASVVVVLMRRREKKSRFFFVLYFVALFIFIKKRAVKGTLFSENIEGKKINGNEWLLMMDHFSKRDLFGKCEKMIIFFCVNFIPFIWFYFLFFHLWNSCIKIDTFFVFFFLFNGMYLHFKALTSFILFYFTRPPSTTRLQRNRRVYVYICYYLQTFTGVGRRWLYFISIIIFVPRLT